MQVLNEIRYNGENELALLAFGMAIKFLENTLMAEQTIKFFEYVKYEPNSVNYTH
jgi:hypothetical protein